MAKVKDQSIETVRGIAVLLVLTGYISRDLVPKDIAEPSWIATALKYIEVALSTIRMPLFTVMSAYLYAAAPAVRETFKKLVTGKFRRIFVPFLTFSTIQFIIFCFTPDSHDHLNRIFRIYFWPTQQLWFLYSVFDIFIIIGILDTFKILEKPASYIAICVAAVVMNISFKLPGLFSVYGVNYLFPYFLLGYGLRRYPDWFLKKERLPMFIAVFCISFLIKPICYIVTGEELNFHYRRVLDILVAYSGVPLIFYFRRPIPALAFIGYYAFGIHLFHRLSILAVRLTFQALHIQDALAIFLGYTIFGVLIALIFQIVCEQFRLTRSLILGLKPDDKPKTMKEVMQTANAR